jgi:non-ribosomal peptide synthetase component E (peptide arylation enzyme)
MGNLGPTELRLMQGLAQQVTALRPDLVNGDATVGELAWVWAKDFDALHRFWRHRMWFADGRLNASHNCLDRHVEAGRGDRVAFHWRGEEGEERDVTYADLLRDVKRLANVLKERGIEPGDVVGIFLPMIPEVAVAMLACARIGAPHNVVFGGFSVEGGGARVELCVV